MADRGIVPGWVTVADERDAWDPDLARGETDTVKWSKAQAQMWPNSLSATSERASDHSSFEVARWLQERASFAKINEVSLQTQLAAFIAEKQDESGCLTRAESLEDSTVYQPLTKAAEFRVLELLPGQHDDQLAGHLHHVVADFEPKGPFMQSFRRNHTNFESRNGTWTLTGPWKTDYVISVHLEVPIYYTALSYVWGAPDLTSSIDLGGEVTDITSNLDVALRNLRHESHSVSLWVDQVCINQSDLREKETQIQLMGLIYRRAWNTLIWLGEDFYHGAFQAMQEMADDTQGLNRVLLEDEKELLRHPPPHKAQAYDAARAMLNNPWFQRTWTIQEVVLSSSPYIMAGRSTCHWEDCIGYCGPLKDLGVFDAPLFETRPHLDSYVRTEPRPLELSAMETAFNLYAMSVSSHTHPSQEAGSLLDILIATRHAKVSNSRDKIFGILGLCTENIVPDYSVSLAKILWETTLTCIRHGGDQAQPVRVVPSRMDGFNGSHVFFQILGCIDHPVGTGGDSPSWVIDWSQPRFTHALAVDGVSRNCFNAGGSSTITGLGLSSDEQKLHTYAKVFDTVHSLSPIITDAELLASDSTLDNTALAQSIAFAHFVSPSTTTGSLFTGFCKVITTGKDGTGRLPYPSEYTEVISYLCDTVTGQSPTFADQVYTQRQQRGRMTLQNLKTRNSGRAFEDCKKAFKVAMLNRRLCWTARGHLGLVPRFAREDDDLVVIPGGAVPYVVRRVRDADGKAEYHLIGEAYVDGVMNGEVMADDTVPLDDLVLL
ncbi:hypothetical protein LTR95_001992 [Oleoguttula sp. CCFEE 5521]